MRPAAVFDLDGTLVRRTSAERLLVPYLVRRGVLGWRQLGRAIAIAMSLPVAGRARALRWNKRYLAGLDVAVVRAHMADFGAEVLEGRWCPAVVSRMEALREEGHSVHLLTGAPDFIAEAVAERFGMESHLGTPMEVREGLFTGRLGGPHYFEEEKRKGVRVLAERCGIDLERSFGFADHRSDVPFLECFGRPVAVEPDTELRREAERRGWEVMGCGPTTSAGNLHTFPVP